MEENRPLVCYCKGAIDSVVDKLTKNKISHPMVDPLLRDLQSLRADLVNKFAGAQAKHKQVMVWMKQIRELVYDIEDWMDTKLTTNMGESEMKIDEQIEEFKTKLMGARARCERYDLIKKAPPPLDAAPSNKDAVQSQLMSEEKAVLVGVDGPKHKLEEHLKGQEKKRKVVSILGVGGHGKTTLGKEVYEKLKGQFECHASVTVGRNSSTTVLKEVLLQVDPRTDPKDSRVFMNEQEVIPRLWEFLQTKRYFVFIDDICNTRAWSVINSVLPNNDLGSRVLTTTRVKDVAMSCTVRSTDVVYEMEDLDEDDSRSLLLTTMSTETEETLDNINKICHYMIKITRGLPLSIIVTAGLISTKPFELGIQGKHGECCLSTLDHHCTSEGMRKVLEICFADLSPPVKSCFVYMSAFPENFTIKKDRLIWRWISEGFIPKRRAESLWETAESYFNELLCRKLIRPEFDDYDDDMAVSCTVQCVIHDFITSLSRQENFLTTATELISGPFPCGTIRRFSVNCSRQDVNEADSLVSSSVHLSRMRSLIVFGGARRVPDLSLFKHLRVLDLEDNYTVDNQQLERIGLLSLLRYLGLAGTNVDKLPHQTTMALKYLVTLDLRRTRVTELPVVGETKLVSVLADGLKLPGGIVQMKQLEELSTVSLDPEYGAWLLSNLKRLRMLGVTFGNIHVLGLKHFLEEVGKSNLQSFLLDEYPCDSIELLVDCWDRNRPHCLRKFEIRMSDYLRVVPQKMASIIALTHLHIRVEQVEAQGVRVLGSLPNLVLLKLFSWNGSHGRLTISSKDGFQCLKVFSFSCSINFGMGLQFGKGAMGQLRRLHIDFSARETKSAYGDFAFGIQHLYSLIEVRAIIRCHNAEASEVEAVKAAIRDQASRIPDNLHEIDLPAVALPSQDMDSRKKESRRTDRCSTSVVVTRISTLPESSSPVPIPGKGTRKEKQRPRKRLPEAWKTSRSMEGVRHLTGRLQRIIRVLLDKIFSPSINFMSPMNALQMIAAARELRMIAAALGDMHQMISQQQLSEKWILQLQDLVYDIEDFVDMNNCLLHNRPRVHADVVSDFRDRLKRLSEHIPGWIIESAKREDSAPLSRPLARSLSTSSVDDELVGIHDTISEILELVTHEDRQPGLRVISVVGCPGVGKTTLAKALYHQDSMRTTFDARVWVPASECSTTMDLLMMIIKQASDVYPPATGKITSDDLNMMARGAIVEHLQYILTLRRLLIIIDDLRLDHPRVKELKSVFEDITSTNVPNLIIVTTSIQSVANIITNTTRRKGVYRMQGLGHRESRELFCRSAFARAEGSLTLDQEYALEETLMRCDGLPLAVINAADIWREQGWMENFSGYQPIPYGAFEKMNRALVRWYKNRGLATFMPSLSIFPSGHLIKKNSLVRKWAAEGLVLGEDGDFFQAHGEDGDCDFTGLFDQFVIEPVLTANNSKVKRCVVRGPLFEFIVRESISNNFVTLIRGEEPSSARPEEKRQNTARVLSIHGTVELGIVEKEIRLDRIRSLTIFDGKAFDFEGCTYLRVLDLECCKGVDEGVVAGICKLVLLRYLSLRGSDVLAIPKKIEKLECLQTLDIRETAVDKLPMEAIMLPQLVHLFGQFELPQQLGERRKRSKLERFFRGESKLQTLSGLLLTDKCNGYKHIALHLRRLRKINICCKHDTVREDSGSRLMSSLQKLLMGHNRLRSLSIDFGDGNMGEYFADYFNNTESSLEPCMLSSIKLRGRLGVLPKFITSTAKYLSELQLSSTGLLLEELSTLQWVRLLLYLKLTEDGRHGFRGDTFVVERDGFPSLLKLCFEAPKLPRLHIVEGAMPALTSLHLLCPEYEHLHHIQKINAQETTSEIQHSNQEWEIEYLKSLDDLVLHPSVGDKELDFWKEKARKNMNRPKVTRQAMP